MRVTYNTALVLSAIAEGAQHGFDVMERTQLPSGTVYPILRRGEANGMLRSQWETPAIAHAAGRPKRRLYELTAAGQRLLERARAHFAHQSRFFSSPRPRPGT